MIRGNREDYMINQRKAPQAWEYGSKCGALRYCYEDLTGGDLDWLASQPFTLRPELPGCEPFIMCHGSPDSINYLFHTNTRGSGDHDLQARGVRLPSDAVRPFAYSVYF